MQNRAFGAGAIKAFCVQQCKACVTAANDPAQCPGDAGGRAIPDVCSRGLQFNAVVTGLVNKCIDMYARDPSTLRTVPGC
jgi:hypothetical protein